MQLCLSFLPQSRWITVPATAMVTAIASPGLATASWASWALTAAEVSAPPHPGSLRVPILGARAAPASGEKGSQGPVLRSPAGEVCRQSPVQVVLSTAHARGGQEGRAATGNPCPLWEQEWWPRVLCKSRFPLGGPISVCRASLTCISSECGLSLASGRA